MEAALAATWFAPSFGANIRLDDFANGVSAMSDRVRFHVENLHSQIADDLIRQIATGAYVAGSALPTEAGLAEAYGVAPNTLRRALDRLAELQLVDRGKGRPTTVADVVSWRKITTLISTVDRDGNRVLGDFQQRNARVELPSETVSVALRQKSLKPVLRFDRLRFYRGRCFMIEDVYVPISRDDATSDQNRLDQLAREIWWNREVAQAKRERVWLEDPTDTDSDLLKLPSNQSIIYIERLLFGSRNLPLEYRIGRCNFANELFYVND